MIRRLLYRLTGGRPMVRLDCAFIDRVSGEEVNRYRDRLGRHWLATSRWAHFRVATDAARRGTE